MCFTFTRSLTVHLVAKIDEYGKGAWIALIVLAFWTFWPLGLAALAFVAFSGRMRCWRMQAPGRWYNAENQGRGVWNRGSWGQTGPHGSGNAAFDDYRRDTLKRLEEEQKEFVEYLERLRQAKDKQEFDQFMADRKSRPEAA